MSKFSKKEAVIFGWETFKSNYWFYLGVIATVGIISWLPEYMRSKLPENARLIRNIYQLIGIVLSSVVTLGFIKIILNSVDKKKLQYSELFKNYRFILKYWLAEIIGGLITVAGFFLFIIPGIILAIKFQFIDYFIIDKGQGPIEAIKSSWEITRGIKWELFVFGLLIIGINLLGLLALGVGIIITYPVTTLAQAYVYRKLAKSNKKKTKVVIEKNV